MFRLGIMTLGIMVYSVAENRNPTKHGRVELPSWASLMRLGFTNWAFDLAARFELMPSLSKLLVYRALN